MENGRFPVDLHCHTVRSDGNITPEELIDKAKSIGLKIIAITDHDIRPPLLFHKENKDIHYSHAYQTYGLHIIPGIEISCQTEVEDVHLLCFGCDWDNEFFTNLETFTTKSKIGAYRKLIEKLMLFDIELNFDDIIKKRGILESEIQKKHIFEEMADRGYTKSWKDAKIFVKENSELSIEREKPDPIDIIREVHQLGGIVILAHPYLIDETMVLNNRNITREEYIRKLIDAGLDGLEIRYSYDKTSYTGALSKDQIKKELLNQFGHLPLVFTGGSDYHADEVKGIKNPRVLGENGMTEEEFLGYTKLANLIL
jgi:3',5'-nucleoside bisphosphate phosphatase